MCTPKVSVTTKDFVSMCWLLEKRSSTSMMGLSVHIHTQRASTLIYLAIASLYVYIYGFLLPLISKQKKLSVVYFAIPSSDFLMSYSCANTHRSVPLP